MRWLALFGSLALATLPVIGTGQGAPNPVQTISGSYAYRTYCVTCHGETGKGDGPLAESLRFHPPDLTQLARQNGGTYPTDKIVRIIDGRDPLSGHGGPDMPVWGDAFKNTESGFDDEQVKKKIRAVAAHLERIQEK